MSVITDVTVVIDSLDASEVIDYIGTFAWGDDLWRVAHLEKLDTDIAGGSKVFCDYIYAGSFNHLPMDQFIDHLSSAPWNPHDSAVVIINHEFSDGHIIFRPGQPLIEYRPPQSMPTERSEK